MSYQDYYLDIAAMAKDVVADARESKRDIDDVLHEHTDGCAHVIYTAQNLNVLNYSDNWSAIEDVEGVMLSEIVQRAAYWAVLADLTDAVSALRDASDDDDDEEDDD